MNIKPQLEDLRLFCVVVRNRSFAATARELGLSKAAVSKRIALLEAALQDKLLHRTTRSLSLTPQGEIVHSWAQRILEDVDLMGEALSHEKATPGGLLRICSSTGFGRNRLAPALSEFARRHPQLEIRGGHVHEGTVIKRRIAKTRRVMCAAPAYLAEAGTPLLLDDLKRHRCIAIRERDQDFGRWDLTGPDGLASGLLVPVLPAYYQPADVWAVFPSRLSASAKVKACVEFLADWFARAGMAA